MTKGSSTTGKTTGMIVMGIAVIITAVAVLSGHLHVQAAGLDVTMGTHEDRGFMVSIDGAQCPGASCPAFAVNWSLATRG